MSLARTRASAARGRRLTASDMARPNTSFRIRNGNLHNTSLLHYCYYNILNFVKYKYSDYYLNIIYVIYDSFINK
jgi:hypothetical protein